ncbi:MAG: hypothetical protein FWF81_03305, partial [Defluviitaleaceae bacterium]|nr:hypothetical protein [Defluviitaleaceae bacterium]
LASVGKAHFRSAAVGGAPHFVRRKNAANAAFSIHISISHTSVEAVAYCVIEIYNVFTGRGSFVPKHR